MADVRGGTLLLIMPDKGVEERSENPSFGPTFFVNGP
jgi:hypothetical protein